MINSKEARVEAIKEGTEETDVAFATVAAGLLIKAIWKEQHEGSEEAT